jgi:hypothetical protein
MCLKRSFSIPVRISPVVRSVKIVVKGAGACLLAASRNPWCSCIVNSGSGSSLSQSFKTLVTLLMSLDHSSASRFVASRSVGLRVRLGDNHDLVVLRDGTDYDAPLSSFSFKRVTLLIVPPTR